MSFLEALGSLAKLIDPELAQNGQKFAARALAGAQHPCGAPGCKLRSVVSCGECDVPMCGEHAAGRVRPKVSAVCPKCHAAVWESEMADVQPRATKRLSIR